jgi:MFS transporter, LPLT family, lysophospholipid transporter
MRRAGGLPLVVAAQFLGAVADSALLVVALQALAERRAPAWQPPALRILFYAAYVLLAVFSGAVADAFAKRDVLVATGLVKVAGCALLLCGVSPLAAYAFVGFGAVSHMPARYGILAELAAPEALLRANAWMEGATMSAALAGVALGGALIDAAHPLLLPIHASARNAAGWLLVPYGAAVLCCAFLRRTAAATPGGLRMGGRLPRRFGAVARSLLDDPAARNAVATTTTFWAAAAVLQFALLRWADERLGLPLWRAVFLQLAVALGMIAGAAAAGRWITPPRLWCVPLSGLAAAMAVAALAFTRDLRVAVLLLLAVGLLAGLVLVPMNAAVQARGAQARRPGEWLAVQHFAENAGSLVLLGVYAAAIHRHLPSGHILLVLGGLIALSSFATRRSSHARRAPAASSTAL